MNVQDYISEYLTPNSEEAILLMAAEAYVHKLIEDDFTFGDGVDIKVHAGDGATQVGNGIVNVGLPATGESGLDRVPVGSVAGYNNTTFMIYDTSVAAAHETSHVILGLLGMSTNAELSLVERADVMPTLKEDCIN